MIQSFQERSGPLLGSVLYFHVSLVLGSPELGPVLLVCLTSAEQKGGIASLISWQLHWAWPRRLHCCEVITSGTGRTPRPFLQRCFPDGNLTQFLYCSVILARHFCKSVFLPPVLIITFVTLAWPEWLALETLPSGKKKNPYISLLILH